VISWFSTQSLPFSNSSTCAATPRAFRMPWPRGTAVFELAHRDVHTFAASALKSVVELYKLNPVMTRSLKAHGFPTLGT
jgi:hypothetical protein